jgi:hypothetical protein
MEPSVFDAASKNRAGKQMPERPYKKRCSSKDICYNEDDDFTHSDEELRLHLKCSRKAAGELIVREGPVGEIRITPELWSVIIFTYLGFPLEKFVSEIAMLSKRFRSLLASVRFWSSSRVHIWNTCSLNVDMLTFIETRKVKIATVTLGDERGLPTLKLMQRLCQNQRFLTDVSFHAWSDDIKELVRSFPNLQTLSLDTWAPTMHALSFLQYLPKLQHLYTPKLQGEGHLAYITYLLFRVRENHSESLSSESLSSES